MMDIFTMKILEIKQLIEKTIAALFVCAFAMKNGHHFENQTKGKKLKQLTHVTAGGQTSVREQKNSSMKYINPCTLISRNM